MDFIKILIFLVIAYICSSVLSTKKFLNFKILLYGIVTLIGIAVVFVGGCVSFYLLQIIKVGVFIRIMIAFIFVILSLVIILLGKDYILSSVRVIEYYLHKKKTLENGYTETGIIVNIKTLGFHRNDFAYYLIVEFNGKQIKSLCFLENKYLIGENIDVIVYKNYNYVVLKN